MSQHFGMFSATVNVGHEESVYSRVTYVDGSPAPRHRALDALCTLAVNARLPYFMNHSTVDGDNFTGVVRNLVRCAAASPQFPKDNDVVCVVCCAMVGPYLERHCTDCGRGVERVLHRAAERRQADWPPTGAGDQSTHASRCDGQSAVPAAYLRDGDLHRAHV